MRLFVGLPISPEVLAPIKALQEHLPAGVRPERPTNLHITLYFIGEVTDDMASSIAAVLAEVQVPRFTLEIRGVGQFPPNRRARVLWVGVALPASLHQLHEQVSLALGLVGLSGEDRAYHPHLTIARGAEQVEPAAIESFLVTYAHFIAPPLVVDHFVLFSSEQVAGAISYHKYRSFPLVSA